jgi:hypothetical protein
MFLTMSGEREQVEMFKQATERKLRTVRCPKHRKQPRVRFEGDNLREIRVSVSGCCHELMELANRAITACSAV